MIDSMLDVEHKPVYGSKESDELICSCGWSGPAFALAEHYEKVARAARNDLENFVTLMDAECAGDEWKGLDALEGTSGFLSPRQFLIAVRNQGFMRADS